MHKKLVSKLIRDIVPTSKRHIISRTPSTVKGFTLLEVMVVTTILATLATTTLVTLNPTELLAQMRDSQRITTIGMLRDAISLLVADAPTTNLGDITRVHISLPSNDPNCADIIGLPTLPSGMFYRCVTAANLTRIDGQGWIPLNFNNIVGGAPFTVLPTDITNTPALFYSYIPSPGGRATLTARIESIRQRTLHPTEIFTTHFTSAVDRPPLGTGQVTVPLGSVGAPSYTFIGDLNTGIFSPLADNIGFSTFGVERMRINDVGNVGIGTLPSASRLTVAGEIHTTTGGIRFPDNTVQVTAGGATGPGGALPGGTLAGQTLRWTGTAWSADSNLFNTGTNVGIGTTAPAGTLHLRAGNSTIRLESDLSTRFGEIIRSLGAGGNLHIDSYRPAGDGGGNIFMNHWSNSNIFMATGGGNVGIAETNPLSRVQIRGHGTTTAGTLNVTDSAGTSRFFVRDDGNVGIGTTAPTARLEVAGNIIAASPLAANHVATRAYVDAALGGGVCITRWGLATCATGWTLDYAGWITFARHFATASTTYWPTSDLFAWQSKRLGLTP